MSFITPGPFSRLATSLVSGLVSIAAQTFAGVKTFTSALIASAGIQVASLFNTNGTGASDVGVKVGFSTPDGSVNSAAKPLSVRTGIGGTEVEKLWCDKDGGLNNVGGYFYGASSNQWVRINGTVGIQLYVSGWTAGMGADGQFFIAGTLQLNTTGSARPTANAANRGKFWYSRSASLSADTVEVCLKSAADTYSWVTIATG